MSLYARIRMAVRNIPKNIFIITILTIVFCASPAMANWTVTYTPIVESGQPVGIIVTVSNGGNTTVSYSDTYATTNPGTSCSHSVTVTYANLVQSGSCTLNGNQAEEQTNYQLPYCNPNNPSTWSANCVMPPACTNPIVNIQPCGVSNNQTVYCGEAECNGPNGLYICNTNYACGTDQNCGIDPCYSSDPNGVACVCSPVGSPGANASYCQVGQNNTASSPCIPQPSTSSTAHGLSSTTDLQYVSTIETELDTLAASRSTVVPNDLIDALTNLSNETNGCTNSN